MKTYHKIRPPYNQERKWEPTTACNILVQEKMDGSNFLFGIVHGEFKIFSRNRDITNESEFQKVNMDSVRALEKGFRTRVESSFPNKTIVLLAGELLGSGRIEYNKNIKMGSDVKDIFIAFDLITAEGEKPLEARIVNETSERDYDFEGHLDFLAFISAINDEDEPFVKSVKTKFVDSIANDPLADDFFEDIRKAFVEDENGVKNSWYDPSFKLEGVVVKVDKTNSAIKVISSKYKETSHTTKPKKQQGTSFEEEFIETYITDPAIEKYLQRLKEHNTIPMEFTKKDFGTIMSNTDDLLKDIFEENIDDIIKVLLKKTSSKVNKKIVRALLDRINGFKK